MSRYRTVSLAGVVLLVLALLPHDANGQGVALAGVRGVVADSIGSPVPLARVEVRHEATGVSSRVLADAAGRFLIANLPPGGPYTVSASHLGFTTSIIEGVQLHAGAVRRLDFELRPAAVELAGVEVRVTANPRFGAERTGTATVVDRAAVEAHPTIQRNVAELTSLAPMATSTQEGFTIAGQNTRFNAFQIDGGTFQDLYGMAGDGFPGSRANARPLPLHAVEQFQVLVTPFDVRHSGFTGGMINVVTRSGTNQWTAEGFGHYRDRRFLGELNVEGMAARPEHFENTMAGLAIGGPLLRDRAHLFIALEVERRTAPSSGLNLGSTDAQRVRIAPDSAARLVRLLDERYSLAPGELGEVALDNPRENLFLRGDWRLGDDHRLMVRHNHAGARRDVGPNRAPVGVYELASQMHRRTARARGTTLQLVSSLGPQLSNELLLNVQRIRDEVEPVSTAPVVEIDILSQFGDELTSRRIRAGGSYDAQLDAATQSGIELRNTLTAGFGRHLLTLGGAAELLRFHSLYLPNPHGLYRFASLAALEANAPSHFERTLLAPDAGDGSVRFSVSQWSAFVQDEWSPTDRLTLRAGLRLDAPHLGTRPRENEALLRDLRVSTATIPEAGLLWSPRFGFNWQSARVLNTQLRGGVGLFSGRPAYAWLASAYAQNGLMSAVLTCGPLRTPELHADARPEECRVAPRPADVRSSPVAAFSEDFRLPHDLRFTAGIDQVLPFGVTASADVVYARSWRQIFLRDLNLGRAVTSRRHEDGYSDGFGFPRRPSFGRPTNEGFTPIRRSDAFHQVIQLDSDAENRSLAASFELEWALSLLRLRGAYTFTRSIDSQSLIHRDVAGNHGGTATAGDPNAPFPSYSDFDRPHKVLVSLHARPIRRWADTDLALVYLAESGARYSYVYAADLNGDGYPGPGVATAFNDLIFVPERLAEIPGSIGSGMALLRLIAEEPCLREALGGIAARNSCRAPTTHRLDMRLAQGVRIGSLDLRVVGDILNVLHLLGSTRGHVYRVAPLVPIVGVHLPRTMAPTPNPAEPLILYYDGVILRDPATGAILSQKPYTLDLGASQWQAQIGVEIRR